MSASKSSFDFDADILLFIETLTAYPNREFVLTAIRNEMATTGDDVLREVLAELLKTLSL